MIARLSLPDVLAGLLVLLVGAVFLISGWHLNAGSTSNMGPGYFPRLVAVGVILLGTAILARAFRVGPKRLPDFPVRHVAGIAISLLAFLLTLGSFGLLIASFSCALIAGFTYERYRLLEVFLMSAAISVVASVLFVGILDVPIKVFPG